MIRPDIKFKLARNIEESVKMAETNFSNQELFQTEYSNLSDKVFYSLFNKNGFIEIYKAKRENGIYDLFQEHANRIAAKANVIAPMIVKEELPLTTGGVCYFFSNKISINLTSLVENFKNAEELDNYALSTLRTVSHEMKHYLQKSKVLSLAKSGDISSLSNTEKIEVLSFLSSELYYQTALLVKGLSEETKDSSLKQLNFIFNSESELYDNFSYYDPIELEACISAIKYIGYLNSKDLLNNEYINSFIIDLAYKKNYSFKKFNNISIDEIQNRVTALMETFTKNNINCKTVNLMQELYQNINWQEYGEHLKQSATEIKNSYKYSILKEREKDEIM